MRRLILLLCILGMYTSDCSAQVEWVQTGCEGPTLPQRLEYPSRQPTHPPGTLHAAIWNPRGWTGLGLIGLPRRLPLSLPIRCHVTRCLFGIDWSAPMIRTSGPVMVVQIPPDPMLVGLELSGVLMASDAQAGCLDGARGFRVVILAR